MLCVATRIQLKMATSHTDVGENCKEIKRKMFKHLSEYSANAGIMTRHDPQCLSLNNSRVISYNLSAEKVLIQKVFLNLYFFSDFEYPSYYIWTTF